MHREPRSGSDSFSDEEASRIWRRAAELQAQRRLPAQGDGRSEKSPVDRSDHARVSRGEILTIAGEAGIDEEFVRQALAEAEFAPDAAAGGRDVYLTRRRVDAPPAVVEAAAEEVAAREPFLLRLVDIAPMGHDRVLVFQLNGDWGRALQAGTLAVGVNITALHALIHEDEDAERTELTLYGVRNPHLPRSVRKHDVAFGTIGGALGGAAGVGIALETAMVGAALIAPVAGGALLLGGAGVGVMRLAQRWARRKDAASLEQLADEIVGAVRIRKHGRQPPDAENLRLTP